MAAQNVRERSIPVNTYVLNKTPRDYTALNVLQMYSPCNDTCIPYISQILTVGEPDSDQKNYPL